VAHGPIHEQIDAVTKQIQADPHNATLYLKRGELRRVHQEWDLALADYDRAAELNPKLDQIDLSRGKLFLASDRPEQAKACLDRFLAKYPDHPDALTTRARVLVNLRQRLAAAGDFTRAIMR